MNKPSLRLTLRHLAALAALALGAAAFGGCAVGPDTDAGEEEDVQTSSDELQCCTGGTFICASNGVDIDYGTPPGACGGSKTLAASACKSQCGGVACKDSGASTFCW